MAAVVSDFEPDDVRRRLSLFVVTDPALFHAVMLVALCHYLTAHAGRPHPIDLLWLRGMAIHEVNRALEDPVRRNCDELIAAVAHMAWFEALASDWDTFSTHMAGLLGAVAMRGGLPTLGLGGILERILLWIDANAAPLRGARLYFDKAAFPTSAVHPRPNSRGFARGVA